MLWKGFYQDFSTNKASASGDFAPWFPTRGSAPWTPSGGAAPWTPEVPLPPPMIYPGATPDVEDKLQVSISSHLKGCDSTLSNDQVSKASSYLWCKWAVNNVRLKKFYAWQLVTHWRANAACVFVFSLLFCFVLFFVSRRVKFESVTTFLGEGLHIYKANINQNTEFKKFVIHCILLCLSYLLMYILEKKD